MKEKEFKLTNIAIRNRTTIYIFTVILVIFGVMQYNSTPKEKFPEIVFPYFMIGTIHPGTSPADVENLITRPIEKHLKGIDGVKQIVSNSIQDYSSIFIEFELSADEVQAYLDVKQAVDDARSELPTDLFQDPDISRIDLSEIPILFINLSGDIGLVKLKELAEKLQDEIEALEEITRADIAGALDREIQINIDLYKMQAAGLSFNSIISAVASENVTISAGQIDTDGMKRNLRAVGEFQKVEEIADIILQDGITIKDVAEVIDDFKDRESYARLNERDVLTLNIIKKSGKNLIFAVDKIKAIVADFQKSAPENLIITLTGDSSTQTRNSVSDLFNTVILGFIVVVFVLMFFMGEANALFVGISIPLSMVIAFILIPVVGFTINMVVLMSFIMVLGIVVDNSIVIVENVYRHFTTTGVSIIEATKKGVGEVALAVFTGTLTTIAPFFPLIFTPGIAGKFMSYLPITIIITLTASILVAYIMNPVFAVSFMRRLASEEENSRNRKLTPKTILVTLAVLTVIVLLSLAHIRILANLLIFGLVIYFLFKFVLHFLIEKFQCCVLPAFLNSYKKALAFLLRGKRPYLILAGTVVLLFLSFILMGIAPPRVVFFPGGDPNTLMVYITMPEGTHIDVTNEVCRQVEKKVFDVIGRDNADVESVVSNVAVNAGSSLFERSTQDKLAKVTISFVEYKFRTGKPTTNYLNDLRERVKGIPGAQIRIDREAMGPPSGMPINIEIKGDEIDELVDISQRLEAFIASLNIQGIEKLKSSMEVNKPELILHIDREKANQLGINTATIGMALRSAIYGFEISKFREGDEEYPIQLRLDKRFRSDIDVLLSQEISVPSKSGNAPPNMIPLSAIASVDHITSYGGIARIDNQRTITLASNVLLGYNANQIIRQINQNLPNFPVPEGYAIKFTGEQDTQAEVGGFFQVALLMALGMIFLILVAQFNSMAKPLIIISQFFFSFTGVLLGFVIFKIDISIMMTGMGIIAVAGVVVKNGIIIIDYIDNRIALGMEKETAIIEAGATRLTPVMLTALSTILGLMPLAIGMNFNFGTLLTRLDPQIYLGGDSAAFWNPLAWTIIFGLAFATILTLIVVPAMYKIIYVRRKPKITKAS
ncbi:MAG: efflux RND transporter permease subunit [Candidatus Aminicenantaceae bacterium]